MFQCARKVAILCISEKLNITLRLKVAGLESIHHLITELLPSDAVLNAYRSKSLNIS